MAFLSGLRAKGFESSLILNDESKQKIPMPPNSGFDVGVRGEGFLVLALRFRIKLWGLGSLAFMGGAECSA